MPLVWYISLTMLQTIMLTVRVALLGFLFVHAAFAQQYTISTFAGGGLPMNIPGTSASLALNTPLGVASDPAGNLFFRSHGAILRLDANSGALTVAAGNGRYGFGGDNGPATSAQLGQTFGVAVDPAGNLYIADFQNFRIRKVSNGVITTVAGNGTCCFSGDNGPATSAQLGLVGGIAIDSAGNLYISESSRNQIRKVSNGVITTVAGNGTRGFSGDNGPATDAQLNQGSGGLAVDSLGNLFIADVFNNRIREVSNGVITTVAGNGTPGFSGDNGPATDAQLSQDSDFGIAVDSSGNLFVADVFNNRVRKVSSGVITTVAGNGTPGFSGDTGPATGAQLFNPWAVAVDSAGNLFIKDGLNYRVRKVSSGIITTVAGNGTCCFSGDNGSATSAQLYTSDASAFLGIAVDSAADLYIADTFNSRVRKVSNGVITTVAGNGAYGFGGDNGPATSAQLAKPWDVAVDSAGSLYIADPGGGTVRKVSHGVITTVAGNGTEGFSGDNGLAISAQLVSPNGVAVDSAGNLYIADLNNYRVRKVSNGVITTVAGNGTPGSSGDNGLATSAQVVPSGIAVDSAGSLYIAESGRIRKVSSGVISTVAGNGTPGSRGDNGPATSAQVEPSGIAVDSAGNLYISDFNNKIRKVSNGVITTIAGNGTFGFSGDNGPATSAGLAGMGGIAVDSTGNVFVADQIDSLIRILIPSGPSCSASVGPTNLIAAVTGGNLSVTIQTSASCAWAVQSLPSWITYSGNAVGTGPSTISLLLAANSGTARSATVSIAGISVSILQAGVSGSLSITTPSPMLPAATGLSYLQTLTATGGVLPYNWSVTSGSLPLGLALSSSGAITGTPTTAGAFTFTIRVTDDASSSATQAYSLAVTSTGPPVRSGSFAHIAAGGSWTTVITLVNSSASPVAVTVALHGDDGRALRLSLTTTQQGIIQTTTTASVNAVLNPNTSFFISAGDPMAATLVGWADVLTSGPVGGFAIFRSTPEAGSPSEGTVPLVTQSPSSVILPYDNTAGFVMGVALANLSTSSVSITATMWDDSGRLLGSQGITVGGSGHVSFVLPIQLPFTSGNRGIVRFQSSGGIMVLGLRFSPFGTFTSVPTMP